MFDIVINILISLVTSSSALILIILRKRMTAKQRIMMTRILLSSAFLLLLQLFSRVMPGGRWLRLALYIADYLLIGYDILRKAFRGIIRGRVLDECFLMAVATLGALGLAVYSNGDYLEAIAVMLFFQIGEWFESYAVARSRKSIGELMDIRPDHAWLEHGDEISSVDPDEVEIGSIIVVRPGEKIPIDGVIIEGHSTLDTSALTGESLPREAYVGEDVISGCISLTGVLRVRTTKEFGESTASKILELVESASSRKSHSENFISKFARIYTPVVCASAFALAILPPLFRHFVLGTDAELGVWIYRALTFLVISCPCALVISIPLSFFAGIGGASRDGILIKGSNYLEALSKTEITVFDKTGTLTRGGFEVTKICSVSLPDSELLLIAAHAEVASSHPIALGLKRGLDIDRRRVFDIEELGGNGVTARFDSYKAAVGNARLMHSLKLDVPTIDDTGSVVHIAIDGTYAGYILLSDTLKPTSREAIAELRRVGVKKTVMLTGDRAEVASKVASELCIDELYAELLPADKVTALERLIEGNQKKTGLAFVGDGINDAPVLARADIGIAMGALGSDAAIEAADVVLMDDDPKKVARAIRIAKKCMSVVRQNIVFALAIKFVCLILGAFGLTNMYLAIFADVGVMVLAVLNAMRCLFLRK